MAEVAADIKELGDKIVGLTLKQAVDLATYLKEEHGIEPAAGGAVMMAGRLAAAPQPRRRRKPRRRPSTSSSRAAATRRSRSSRSFARPPAWA